MTDTKTVLHLGTVQFGGDMSNEVIHLEADNVGSTLCGIELFPRDEHGNRIPMGWSRGGGDTGPRCRRVPCETCRDAVPDGQHVVITDRTFHLDWKKPVTTSTEGYPRVVGATAVHLVGVEGTIEAIGEDTITIDGVTLPTVCSGTVRYISMHWPADQVESDHDGYVPEDDYNAVERESLRYRDGIAKLHEENHPGVFSVCLHEVCRAVGV